MGQSNTEQQKELENKIWDSLIRHGPQDASQLAVDLLFPLEKKDEEIFFEALKSLKKTGWVYTTPTEGRPEIADKYTSQVYHLGHRPWWK
ncbi:MAG: hypothetical protein ABIJ21_04425 [Nanoarchaeota archaeon]